MRVIGLTGGVACGKTTVAKRLGELGFPIVDTDEIAHALLEKDSSVRKRVHQDVGTTDRSELRALIFGNEAKRSALEKILHPAIGREVESQLNGLRKRKPAPAATIVVVPLLYEAGWNKKVDAVIAVVCEESEQIERLMKRDGIKEALARQMVQSQISNPEKANRADYTIQNNGTLEILDRQIDIVVRKIRQR